MIQTDTLKKHFGFLKNTGARILVIFRSLPVEPKNALVVSLDSLPDAWRDEVINAANSQAGQSTVDFYTVLQNRNFSDGSNVLNGLHNRGYLKKTTTENVTMTPLTGQNVPLDLINASIDKTLPEYIAANSPEAKKSAEEKLEALKNSAPLAKAQLLLDEADRLEFQAGNKRVEAYKLAPELNPGAGRPKTPDSEKERIREERLEKRRIRERANRQEQKAEKSVSLLEDKILKKMERDAQRPDPIELNESDES